MNVVTPIAVEVGTDRWGRRIDYLRISLTERCNLRCVYCRPATDATAAGPALHSPLSNDELERIVCIARDLGVRHVRLTGGEPLLRPDLVELVERLAGVMGPGAVALTTNGSLLRDSARQLKAAGLARVNVSLDTLDASRYSAVTRGGSLDAALAGVEAALAAGLEPVKLNAVVTNSAEQDLGALAALSVDRPLHVRFIERMPLGESVTSASDGTPAEEILADLARWALDGGFGELVAAAPGEAPETWGPARTFRLPGALGTIGIISPLSDGSCARCNRLRLTADGRLRPCLMDDREIDLRAALRGADESIAETFARALSDKPRCHDPAAASPRRAMSQIGG